MTDKKRRPVNRTPPADLNCTAESNGSAVDLNPEDGRRTRRADVTPDEKSAVLKAVQKLYEDEGPRSTRGYAYKLGKLGERGEIFLHGEPCTKNDKNDETIQRLLLAFRLDKQLSWDAVLDPSRRTIDAGSWESPREALETVTERYRQSIWMDQPHRVELLSEKEALTAIIEPVTYGYQVPLTPMKGFNSWTKFWDIATGIVLIGRPTWVLVLTDHDRAGLNMWDSAQDTLRRLLTDASEEYGAPIPDVWFDRIGLTRRQIERYGCGTRPCKASEQPHWKNHVPACAEVDWLTATQIAETVREGIQSHMDRAAMRASAAQERRDKAALRRFARQWRQLRGGDDA